MNKKMAGVSAVGGADGPTSVYIAGKRRTFRQKLQKWRLAVRKRRVMKHIKADPHTMDEVMEYIKSNGYEELSADTSEYQREYDEMRVSFLLQHEPHLLGELAELPKLEDHSADSIKAFIELNARRQKAAEEIPRELFDIDLHIFDKRPGDASFRIVIEKKYGYIGGSAAGKKRIKELHDLCRRAYQYYGVTQEDIDQKTARYETLVRALSMPAR